MRVALLLLLLAALAGCGGTEQAASVVDADVAAIAPASAPVVLALETDPESEQWRQADRLLERFPGRARLLDELRRSLAEEGVDAEDELLPALGDETYVVLLDFEDGGENVVVLTQPRDPEKLRQVLRESDEPTVTREVEGWTLVARSDALLDRFTADGDRLEDAEWFGDAQGRVEDDALVTFLVNGAAVEEATRTSVPAECDLPEGRFEYLAGTVTAEEHGIRLAYASAGDGADVADGGSLLSRVPSGALLYLGLPPLAGLGVTESLRCTTDDQGLPDLERLLGVSYDDLGALFAGGMAFSVRPASLVPEVTLLLAPEDEAAALATLDRLADRATSAGLGEVRPRTVEGVEAKELQVGPVSVLYGGGDGRVALTTSAQGLRTLAGDIESLRDDEGFRAALDAAGVEDEEQVFAYVDVQQVVELARTLARLADEELPPDATSNVEPLRSVVMWGDVSDPDAPEGGAFLEIR